MTETTVSLTELLGKRDEGDFLRAVAEAVLQPVTETDVEGVIGAGRHERAEGRTTYRNGYRDRALDTRPGTLNLRVPKLRQGSHFPFGPSIDPPDRSMPSAPGAHSSSRGGRRRRRSSRSSRVSHRAATGSRPMANGIGGVSIRRVDELVHVPRGQHTVAAAAIRRAFSQSDREQAGATWRHVADQIRGRWPKLAALMDASEHDVLACMAFPAQHRSKSHSTNPIERLNNEVKRRADVVGFVGRSVRRTARFFLLTPK
jgi:transposase-like protein